jgi:hypothetical protein
MLKSILVFPVVADFKKPNGKHNSAHSRDPPAMLDLPPPRMESFFYTKLRGKIL